MDWKADYAGKLTTADRGGRGRQVGRPGRLRPRLRRAAGAGRRPRRPRPRAARRGDRPHGRHGQGRVREARVRRRLLPQLASSSAASTREAVNDGRGDYVPDLLPRDPGPVPQGLPPAGRGPHPGLAARQARLLLVRHLGRLHQAGGAVAKTVIAQVNPNMPRTHGDSFIHVSRHRRHRRGRRSTSSSCRRRRSAPSRRPSAATSPAWSTTARACSSASAASPTRCCCSCTRRTTSASTPRCSARASSTSTNEGVITNARKQLHRDKMVANFLMGTRRLYDFVDDNPAVNMFPVNYVNDPFVIGQNDKVVAINSAIQVDLMGQVVADTMGPMQFTGIGGQVDFVRGAARSKGGKAIIALPSTAKKGTVSRIVAAAHPRRRRHDHARRRRLRRHRARRRPPQGQGPARARLRPARHRRSRSSATRSSRSCKALKGEAWLRRRRERRPYDAPLPHGIHRPGQAAAARRDLQEVGRHHGHEDQQSTVHPAP